MQKENEDELLAKNWLIQQGYSDIHRPYDDPPDFIVDGKYAVEVTRLSRRIKGDNETGTIALEEKEIPLTNCIEKVINKLGPLGNSGVYWEIVCKYNSNMPLPDKKSVCDQIETALSPLLKPYDKQVISNLNSRYSNCHKHDKLIYRRRPLCLCLKCGICLLLTEEYSSKNMGFIIAEVSDDDGGWIAEELCCSIPDRIIEKSEKVCKHSNFRKYDIWWLILVSHVFPFSLHGLSEEELSFIQNINYVFWSQVVIVSVLDLSRYNYLIKNGTG